MRVRFEDYTDILEVLKFNNGIKPKYGKGTMKGCIWCSCGCYTGNILLFENNKIIGQFDTECSICGNQINYFENVTYINYISS